MKAIIKDIHERSPLHEERDVLVGKTANNIEIEYDWTEYGNEELSGFCAGWFTISGIGYYCHAIKFEEVDQ